MSDSDENSLDEFLAYSGSEYNPSDEEESYSLSTDDSSSDNDRGTY